MGSPEGAGSSLSHWVPGDSRGNTHSKQSGHVDVAVPHRVTQHWDGSLGGGCHFGVFRDGDGGDVAVPCPGIPGQHVPGGTAGSIAPCHIRLAAPVEATLVSANGVQ